MAKRTPSTPPRDDATTSQSEDLPHRALRSAALDRRRWLSLVGQAGDAASKTRHDDWDEQHQGPAARPPGTLPSGDAGRRIRTVLFLSSIDQLYVIHCANHSELTYRGGQGPIVHLEADLHRVIGWANGDSRRWAFSLSNAGATYAQFRSEVSQLDEVDWPAVAAWDFRAAEVKEGKQAEFLVHGSFPWELIERIGVISQRVAQQVANAIRGARHRPNIEIRCDWYY